MSSESPPRRVWILLPAYDEAGNIGTLLRDLQREVPAAAGELQLLVVDDGSRDGTAELARAAASEEVLHLLQHPRNLGLGATLHDGLLWLRERCQPGDVIVTLDADGSHPAACVADLLRALDQGADLAIASRYRPGARSAGLPPHRRALSFGARLVGQALVGLPGVRDFTCGFRALRAELLLRAFAELPAPLLREPGFGVTLELLLRLAELAPRVRETPLDLRYDLKQSASKMRILLAIRQNLRLMTGHRLRRLRHR